MSYNKEAQFFSNIPIKLTETLTKVTDLYEEDKSDNQNNNINKNFKTVYLVVSRRIDN